MFMFSAIVLKLNHKHKLRCWFITILLASVLASSSILHSYELLFFCFAPWLFPYSLSSKACCLDYYFQDCAGAILCAAERATQVALQVNKQSCSHRLQLLLLFFYSHFLVLLPPPNFQAIQCLGGNGYVNEYPTGRLLRDAKLYEIGAGTSEIRRMIIGRELFKE